MITEAERATLAWRRYRRRGWWHWYRPVVTFKPRAYEAGARGVVVAASANEFLTGALDRPRVWRSRLPGAVPGLSPRFADLNLDDHSRPFWTESAQAYQSVPLDFLRLRDALVLVGSGIVTPKPGVVVAQTFPAEATLPRPLPGAEGPITDTVRLRLGALRPTRVIDGPVLSLCHVYGHGYGHWLSDDLPPLIDLLPQVHEGRLKLLAPPLLPWQRRCLELLEVPDAAIIEVAEPTVSCADLVCHAFQGGRHTRHVGGLIGAFFDKLGARRAPAATGHRLIYASRSAYRAPRVFVNEQELEKALGAIGFTILHPETMSLDDQIAAFSQAAVVVTPNGSALINVGFAPRGCLLVDIVPRTQRYRWAQGLTQHFGHHLVVIAADGDAPTQGDDPKFTLVGMEYRVDVGAVVARVQAAMARLSIAA